MRVIRVVSIFFSVWLASAVALSSGSLAPELSLISNAKSSTQYQVLRDLQQLTLELQLLEITIKNRKDPQTEERISAATAEMHDEGIRLAEIFKTLKSRQLEGLFGLFLFAQQNPKALTSTDKAQWLDLLKLLRNGQFQSGALSVLTQRGPLQVLNLSPLQIENQTVWMVSLPEDNRHSYWFKNPRTPEVQRRIFALNQSYLEAENLSRQYFKFCYAKLYRAFEDHRYAILQRVALARKSLDLLSRDPSSMSVPEQYSALYNQAIENLFSYGVNVRLVGTQRDFAVKGFLFGESLEEAQSLIKKLKHTVTPTHYNSPSS